MNTTLLIEALVRQTTVLLATLATTDGTRTPLARIADQVFASLVNELKSQGLGNKVIADMFGLALRTYHHRMARLQESNTEAGRSLWMAVLEYIDAEGTVLRTDVLQRFSRDDVAQLRSVLRDLVDSRLVFQTGRGHATAYRAATPTDGAAMECVSSSSAVAAMLLVLVHRHGPLSHAELLDRIPLPEDELSNMLAALTDDGRLVRAHTDGAPATYHADHVYIPIGDRSGWQAALFDHYQAVVTAMVTKLLAGDKCAREGDAVGGSTYHFDVWPGHPLESEVMGLLRTFRRQAVALRTEVERYNEDRSLPTTARRVIAYVGQTVLEEESGDDDAEQD